MGQHLIPQALEGELEEFEPPQGMGQSGLGLTKQATKHNL